MRKTLLFVCLFSLFVAACKKEPPVQPEPIYAVVLDGAFWSLGADGYMNYLSDVPQGQRLMAYPNTDKKEKDFPAEIRRDCPNTRDSSVRSYVHVFVERPETSDDADVVPDMKDVWVQEEAVILQAIPVLLVEEMPFVYSIEENSAQFTESPMSIPANSIIALHDKNRELDYLMVSYRDTAEEFPIIRTGFIPNPHPFFSSSADDLRAIRLYNQSLLESEKETKKTLLDAALALELSPKTRAMIQSARKELDPPPAPKPNVSYERVRIPPMLKGGSKSRYSVNMGELLTGGTEDPWAKKE